MKWNLAIEEQFQDLSIISELVREKVTVKGNFEDGIYIRGKQAKFEKVPVCGNKVSVYLPVERKQTEKFGKEFVCPEQMEWYEEYVCGLGTYGIAFEICHSSTTEYMEISIEEEAESFCEEIQEHYEDTTVEIADILNGENLLCSFMARGEISGKTMISYIYFIRSRTNLFRFYLFCDKSNWKEMGYLAAKIADNIELSDETGQVK